LTPGGEKFVLNPIVGKKDRLYNSPFFGAHLVNDKAYGTRKKDKDDARTTYNSKFINVGLHTRTLIRKGTELFVFYNRCDHKERN